MRADLGQYMGESRAATGPGRLAIVTGASTGIGHLLARCFSRDGRATLLSGLSLVWPRDTATRLLPDSLRARVLARFTRS